MHDVTVQNRLHCAIPCHTKVDNRLITHFAMSVQQSQIFCTTVSVYVFSCILEKIVFSDSLRKLLYQRPSVKLKMLQNKSRLGLSHRFHQRSLQCCQLGYNLTAFQASIISDSPFWFSNVGMYVLRNLLLWTLDKYMYIIDIEKSVVSACCYCQWHEISLTVTSLANKLSVVGFQNGR